MRGRMSRRELAVAKAAVVRLQAAARMRIAKKEYVQSPDFLAVFVLLSCCLRAVLLLARAIY